MVALPSGNAGSLSTLVQGFFNESANQRSTGIALRNILFEKQRDRDNRWMHALEVAREHEAARKAKHEETVATERAAIGSIAGAAVGGVVGGPLLAGGMKGAMLGAGIGTGVGMTAAGQPQGPGMMANSLMQAPGVMDRSRLSDQLFDIRESQADLDAIWGPIERQQGSALRNLDMTRNSLELRLMSSLVDLFPPKVEM